MKDAKIFLNNRTQAVRLPADVRFPGHVDRVAVRTNGCERILCPVEELWNSFFEKVEAVSPDFGSVGAK